MNLIKTKHLLISGFILISFGCKHAQQAWVQDPQASSPVTGSWEGKWWKEEMGPDGGLPLRCVCLETKPNQWTATFEAQCGRPAAYTFDIRGQRRGNLVIFKDSVDLGPEDGGVYHWKGEVRGSKFVGEYTNKTYIGRFEMSKQESPSLL